MCSRSWGLRLTVDCVQLLLGTPTWPPGCSDSSSLKPLPDWAQQEQTLPPSLFWAFDFGYHPTTGHGDTKPPPGKQEEALGLDQGLGKEDKSVLLHRDTGTQPLSLTLPSHQPRADAVTLHFTGSEGFIWGHSAEEQE